MLTPGEILRYQRNIIAEDFGEEGQRRLKAASVLVVGAGGLGSPVIYYLGAAGVGKIGIAEFDTVSESNLQRQILYTGQDLGSPKADIAAARLNELNPHIRIEKYPYGLTPENAEDIVPSYDIVVDCTDNYSARYIIDHYTSVFNKPMVYGTAQQWGGQVSVFNCGGAGRYCDLYPRPDNMNDSDPVGVLSPIPGIIGSIQAAEVVKLITGIGETLCRRLLVVDVKTMEFSVYSI